MSIFWNRGGLDTTDVQVDGCGAFIIDGILPQVDVQLLLNGMSKNWDGQEQLKKNGKHIWGIVACGTISVGWDLLPADKMTALTLT